LADHTLQLDSFADDVCYLGLDLASKTDLCAVVPVITKTESDGKQHYYCIAPCFYLPEETIFNHDNPSTSERYQRWLNEGFLYATEGAEVDYNVIQADIIALSQQLSIAEVPHDPWGAFQLAPHDPWGAFQLAHRLEEEGLLPVKIPQNVAHLSPAMKELNAAILSGRFHHDGHPVLTWMISNVTAKEDANENVFPRKEKADNKIDGAVALIMAVGRAMSTAETFNPLNDFDPDEFV